MCTLILEIYEVSEGCISIYVWVWCTFLSLKFIFIRYIFKRYLKKLKLNELMRPTFKKLVVFQVPRVFHLCIVGRHVLFLTHNLGKHTTFNVNKIDFQFEPFKLFNSH